jgi:hypothetical protein
MDQDLKIIDARESEKLVNIGSNFVEFFLKE